MVYINNERIAEIKNALAVILRVSFDTKQEDRRIDIVRQVGRIGGLLLPKIKGDRSLAGWDELIRGVNPERMDHLEKGAHIGKPKEVRKKCN